MTIAGTAAYPKSNPTPVPNNNGVRVVRMPKKYNLFLALSKRERSTSKPAKNISSNFPISEKKPAMG
jgi:hypothetical protein